MVLWDLGGQLALNSGLATLEDSRAPLVASQVSPLVHAFGPLEAESIVCLDVLDIGRVDLLANQCLFWRVDLQFGKTSFLIRLVTPFRPSANFHTFPNAAAHSLKVGAADDKPTNAASAMQRIILKEARRLNDREDLRMTDTLALHPTEVADLKP